jgi:hypothetical protein
MLRPSRVLLLALASAVLLTVPQPAGAGTYTVLACSPTASSGGWQSVNSFPSGLAVGNMCGGSATGPNAPTGPTDEGALFAEDSTNTTADIPNGAEAGWRFTAPAGTSIAGLTYWRSLHAYDQQSLVPGLWTGEGTTLESCQAPPEGTHECNDLNNQGPQTFTNLNASSLFFGVRCSLVDGSEYCVPAAPGERHAQADLYSATVTLSETSSPTVSSVTGAGWSGGVISGQAPLALTADDPSGIADVEVRSSLGTVLANAPQSCDYYLAVPCPELSGATIGLNTSAAPEGPQSFILTVRDAAGNESIQTSPLVTIDNHPPAPPTGNTSPTGKTPPPVILPPSAAGGGKVKEKLHALLDTRGHLFVAGPIPNGVSNARVCWHAKRGKRALGSRCVTLHVKAGRIAVTFHPSARARLGQITVTISKGHSLIARLTAKRAHSA